MGFMVEGSPMGLQMLQANNKKHCTGAAGIEATEAAADLMKANIDRKAASEGKFSHLTIFRTFFCALILNL